MRPWMTAMDRKLEKTVGLSHLKKASKPIALRAIQDAAGNVPCSFCLSYAEYCRNKPPAFDNE